jgi:hypothetical protein
MGEGEIVVKQYFHIPNQRTNIKRIHIHMRWTLGNNFMHCSNNSKFTSKTSLSFSKDKETKFICEHPNNSKTPNI